MRKEETATLLFGPKSDGPIVTFKIVGEEIRCEVSEAYTMDEACEAFFSEVVKVRPAWLKKLGYKKC